MQPYDQKFKNLSEKYLSYKVVTMPETWRKEGPVDFTFVLFEDELNREELLRFFKLSYELNLVNPRPISLQLVKWSSLFHPLFFHSIETMARDENLLINCTANLPPISPLEISAKYLETTTKVDTFLYYLQTNLFLAGCTLTAAIVNDRFSPQTLESKYSHLWRAAFYAERFRARGGEESSIYEAIHEMKLAEFIDSIAFNTEISDYDKLIQIKKQFSKALSIVGSPFKYKTKVFTAEKLSPERAKRFAFVDQLKAKLQENLLSVIAYGSSVTSEHYSDYDVYLIVKDESEALKQMAKSKPSHQGLEINVGIYSLDNFIIFQTLSGDNLEHNALCLYGEAKTVIKPDNDLLMRNFSFAFVRMRQLLGMAAYLSYQAEQGVIKEARSLYEYFTKIPMHIYKGTCSVFNENISKELIKEWISETHGYDIDEQLNLVSKSEPDKAVAYSYLATMAVLNSLNNKYRVNC